MRLVYMLVLWVGIGFPTHLISQENINFFRHHFENAKTEEDFKRVLDTEVSDTSQFNLNVIEAYKSVSHSAMAQYVFNPYSKFKMFHEGKDRLEATIQKEASVENIFLRLVVQLNIPAFLGYSKDVEHDLNYLNTHLEDANIPVKTKKFIVRAIIKTDNDNYDLDSLSLLKFKENKTS